MKRYPHQLSGGMLQRCVIAMALMTNPSLLIMDEPTTALDVTTQAVVLDLVAELKREFDSAILYITHDLGVITKICDRVGVMYAGEFMEQSHAARALHAAAAPVHARPARLRAALRPHAGEALAGHHPRLHPARGRAAAGLHLRAALRVRRGRLHGGATAAATRSRRTTSPPACAGASCRRRRSTCARRRRPFAPPTPSVRGRRSSSQADGAEVHFKARQGRSSAPSTAWTSQVMRRPDARRRRRERQRQDHRGARHHRPDARPPAARSRCAARRCSASTGKRPRVRPQRDPDGVPEPGRVAQPDAHGGRRHHAAALAARRPGPRRRREQRARELLAVGEPAGELLRPAAARARAAARSSAWPSRAPSPPSPS